MTTLNQLKAGQLATVRCIRGGGSVFQRLLEMGLVKGTRIELVRFAPLGDPIEIKLMDYNLSLRGSEAQLVEVELDNQA